MLFVVFVVLAFATFECSCIQLPGELHADSVIDLVSAGTNNSAFSNKQHDQTNAFESHRAWRTRRQSQLSIIKQVREPYTANERSAYVELLLVLDHTMYEKYNGKHVEYCKSLVNIMNSLYTPLNIFIVLSGVHVMDSRDSMYVSSNAEKTLSNCKDYIKYGYLNNYQYDHVQFLTTIRFEDKILGKASVSTMCSPQNSTGIISDHASVEEVATTMAHEMGHSFGLKHDDVWCSCEDPNGHCIMAETSSKNFSVDWSKCSINAINEAMHNGLRFCLRNKPFAIEPTREMASCGNGLLEEGEQCDCGLFQFCKNPCCDAATCRYKPHAKCAHGKCCNLEKCEIKNATNVCRASKGECDLPEYCTRSTEFCPDDVFVQDTTKCMKGESFCYHGHCHTHLSQCRALWGTSARAAPLDMTSSFYKTNMMGSEKGNCGYNPNTNRYTRCKEKDIFCGTLKCIPVAGESGQINTEMRSSRNVGYRPSESSIQHNTYTFNFDYGKGNVDPGLAQDGTKCGVEKICVDQQCHDVDELQKRRSLNCKNDCNGHGVCNSLRECHCEDGYDPPFCHEVVVVSGGKVFSAFTCVVVMLGSMVLYVSI